MDDQITNGANQLLNYGALGLFCLFLIVALYLLWKHGEEKQKLFWSHLKKRDEEFLKRVDKFNEITEKYAVQEALQNQTLQSLEKVIQAIGK